MTAQNNNVVANPAPFIKLVKQNFSTAPQSLIIFE